MSDDRLPSAFEPEKPKKAFRLTLNLTSPKPRLDQVILEELRKQNRSLALRNISRIAFKELFKKRKVRIKGQPAVPSSSLARGITYVDILGYGDDDDAIL
jgi:hypothetical protein